MRLLLSTLLGASTTIAIGAPPHRALVAEHNAMSMHATMASAWPRYYIGSLTP
jgi:hypothetical protein